MKERDFDNRLKQRMESYGETPDPSIWLSIESKIIVPAKGGRVVFVKVFRAVAAVAAAVLMFYIAGRELFIQESETPLVEVLKIEESPAEVNIDRQIPERGEVPEILPARRVAVASVERESQIKSEENQTDKKTEPETGQPETKQTATSQPETRQLNRDYANDFSGDFPIELQIKKRRGRPSLAFSTTLAPSVGTNERVLHTFAQSDFKELSSSLDREQNQPETVYDTRYLPSVSVGLQVMIPLSKTFSVATGLSYSALYSITDEQRFSDKIRNEQTLHYIGLPLYLYANIYSTERLFLYGGAGAMVEKGIAERIKRSGPVPQDYTNRVDGLQWSAGATIGAEYRLGRRVGLYADPMVMYYFDCNQPKSIRSAQPLQFKLEIGLRYRF